MPVLRNPLIIILFITVGLLAVLLGGAAQAAPSAAPPAPVSAPAPVTVPDYGGRDSSPLAVTGGDAAPNPAAQAGRALEALVVVLAGVVGVIFVLKRFVLVKPGANGQPARITGPSFARTPAGDNSEVTVVSTQTLPGGAMLHVVRVAGKNLLLAATAHTVTTVSEWPAEKPAPNLDASPFEDHLSRADPATGIAAANARLRSLLSPTQPEDQL